MSLNKHFETENAHNDVRADVLELLDEQMISPEYLVTSLLNYMSQDDVRDCLHKNEIKLLNEFDLDE